MIRYNQAKNNENDEPDYKFYTNRNKFRTNYIRGLRNYFHYLNSSNSASHTGAMDANFYASVLTTK